jgi:hypothetical protein
MNQDPVWLTEVLRAEGLQVEEYPGAYERGHGDFGWIWGVVAHHTGSNPPSNSPGGIAEHPDLGLASQLHLSRSGLFTLCGVGIAWHAGTGSWPGIPPDDANSCTIGIEAENSGSEGWSFEQYDAYHRGVGAILRHLGLHSDRVIGHKEWGAAQGKWDPGGINMDVFRFDVQNVIDSKQEEDNMPQPEAGEILNQETGSHVVGEFPGWASRRHNLREGENPHFTQLDYAREIDRELNSLVEVDKSRPRPIDQSDSLLGHVLSLRAELHQLIAALVDRFGEQEGEDNPPPDDDGGRRHHLIPRKGE